MKRLVWSWLLPSILSMHSLFFSYYQIRCDCLINCRLRRTVHCTFSIKTKKKREHRSSEDKLAVLFAFELTRYKSTALLSIWHYARSISVVHFSINTGTKSKSRSWFVDWFVVHRRIMHHVPLQRCELILADFNVYYVQML